jgi:dihydroorotate dehydrogenase (NAD+) catalytic subunit
MLAGATAVQVGTANFINPRVTEEIIEGMYAYANAEKLQTIRSLIGGLQIKGGAIDPFEQTSC